MKCKINFSVWYTSVGSWLIWLRGQCCYRSAQMGDSCWAEKTLWILVMLVYSESIHPQTGKQICSHQVWSKFVQGLFRYCFLSQTWLAKSVNVTQYFFFNFEICRSNWGTRPNCNKVFILSFNFNAFAILYWWPSWDSWPGWILQF